MTWEEYNELRQKGSGLFIILITSGLGGLLNAIVDIKELTWKSLGIGNIIVFILSSVLIILGLLVWRYFLCKAEKIRKTLIKTPLT